LLCILIAGFSGANKSFYMFEAKTANLSISSSNLANFENLVGRGNGEVSSLTTAALTSASSTSTNITASDLGLADYYTVSLWNYCSITSTNKTCSKPAFNWAASTLNTTKLTSLTSSTGVNVTLPKEITSALKTFTTVNRWTEVVYIIALIATIVELIFGFFALCSRVGSCCTFIVSGVSTVAIMAASVMASVMDLSVVGALDSAGKAYGMKASFNTSWLTSTWLAVVFSLGGALFWMFTICCCAADHHSKGNRRSNMDTEKLIPTGAYQRVEEPYISGSYDASQQHGVYNTQQEYGIPMHQVKAPTGNAAYEPYSHTAI
jgi:hypothetical protein